MLSADWWFDLWLIVVDGCVSAFVRRRSSCVVVLHRKLLLVND